MAMKLTVKVWRQLNPESAGGFETYELDNVIPEMSFLEMLDVLNEKLISEDKRPVEFDNDCREGICGMCGCTINGQAHGQELGTTCCQLHMRKFSDGETVVIEPFRAKGFPVIRDLVVDRSAFDRIISAGGYVDVNTGPQPDGNATPISKIKADVAMDAAACIGCGACVASCPNASASLFTGAKITQFSVLPQGQPERNMRARKMVEQMDAEGFGSCTNMGECTSACPKEIPLSVIARMKWDYMRSMAMGD